MAKPPQKLTSVPRTTKPKITVKKAQETTVPKQIGGDQLSRGLTSKQLMLATARHFPTRIENVKAYGVKVVRTKAKDANEWRLQTTEGTKGHTEAKFHHQQIRRLEAKPFNDSRLALWCDCSDYKFMFEYALFLRGCALEPHQSNLEPSVIKNPTHAVGCCKHLLACLGYIKVRKL